MSWIEQRMESISGEYGDRKDFIKQAARIIRWELGIRLGDKKDSKLKLNAHRYHYNKLVMAGIKGYNKMYDKAVKEINK